MNTQRYRGQSHSIGHLYNRAMGSYIKYEVRSTKHLSILAEYFHKPSTYDPHHLFLKGMWKVTSIKRMYICMTLQVFNIHRTRCEYSHQTNMNYIFQYMYNLKWKSDSFAHGSAFNKLKHGSIIVGCWDIQWGVHFLFLQAYTSVDISTWNKLASYKVNI